jgi:hypothetical protein
VRTNLSKDDTKEAGTFLPEWDGENVSQLPVGGTGMQRHCKAFIFNDPL